MLARLGEAGPAAVLSGALAAHVPGALTAIPENQRRAFDRSQALARDGLGEAAYDAAVGRGAAMDENEVAGYAVGELRRVAGLLAEPGAQAPHASPGAASRPHGNDYGSAPPGMTLAKDAACGPAAGRGPCRPAGEEPSTIARTWSSGTYGPPDKRTPSTCTHPVLLT